jgi:hypothetical protein
VGGSKARARLDVDRRLGGAQPGNRLISLVRSYARGHICNRGVSRRKSISDVRFTMTDFIFQFSDFRSQGSGKIAHFDSVIRRSNYRIVAS